MIVEIIGHIARLGAEKGDRGRPGIGIRLLRVDISGNFTPREEPHFDTLVIPQMGKDTTGNHVEGFAVATRVGVREAAPSVVAWSAGALVMEDVGLDSNVIQGECAACPSVKGILVGFLFMDTFENIDFP